MNIVDLAPDDITLDEAAHIASRSTKTLRRAIQDGQFPRRYVLSPRGPQLVFRRADLERWLDARQARSRTTAHSSSALHRGSQREWFELSAKVAELQTLLDENRSTIAQLTAKLHDQDDAMSDTQATISQLVGKLATLEARSAATAQAERETSTQGAQS